MPKTDKIILTVSITLIVLSGLIYFIWNWQSSLFSEEGAIKGNVFQVLFASSELKTDQNNHINILVFGTSEDKPVDASSHENYSITNSFADSIFVLSIDKITNETSYINIPRDIIINNSDQCNYEHDIKLKVIYLCYSSSIMPNQTHMTGANKLKDEVENITGMEIPYFVKVNYLAVSKLVDLVGGIDIVPFSDDPRGIYDPPTGLNIPYGEQMHLSGDNVMMLMRARNSVDSSYGLSEGEAARAKNQQLILRELITKLRNSNELSDPFKALGLVNALERHIMTNFDATEVKSAMHYAKSIGDMQFINLSDEKANLIHITVGEDRTHTSHPNAGDYNYTEIHKYLQDVITKADNK